MENSIDILNELLDLSPTLAAMEKVNVFTVPDGYFEYVSADIMAGIGQETGGHKNRISVLSGAEVPHDYFDTLADTILQRIKAKTAEDAATEIRVLSPMLYSVQNENVFETPPGYFRGLSENILNKVKPRPAVIRIQRLSSFFFRYAVAAAFTGMMALGVFKFTSSADEKIPLPDYVTAGLQVQNVDQELDKISDADIVKYLESGGTDVKAAFVANSIEKNDLPAQEEYLMDDQALDKYLNHINLNDLKN